MNAEELMAGHKAFVDHEARDAMYKTATFLVNYFWYNPAELSNSLGVLLLTWNQAFYRYGSFDYDELETCIVKNKDTLQGYRNRNILSYTSADDVHIIGLYEAFLAALQIAGGKSAGRRSPVSASKALHLMAPEFFPLQDDKIATEYGCHYSYIPFIKKMKSYAEVLAPQIDLQIMGETLLKLIDEFNYAKFTKAWIQMGWKDKLWQPINKFKDGSKKTMGFYQSRVGLHM